MGFRFLGFLSFFLFSILVSCDHDVQRARTTAHPPFSAECSDDTCWLLFFTNNDDGRNCYVARYHVLD